MTNTLTLSPPGGVLISHAVTRAALPTVSVVVPVYNAEKTIEPLVERLAAVLTASTSAFEIILVNDGSRDASGRVAKHLAERHAFVRALSLMRNYGQHNAVLAGIRAAKYAITVTMDDDLQHPPEELGKLVAKLEEGFDVVYGTPQHEQHGLLRDAASVITKAALQSTMGTETARMVSAFRVMRTSVREAFSSYRGPFVHLDVLLTWSSTRFAAVKVRHDARQLGKSNYTFSKLAGHTLSMVTGFSVLPLQLASIIGFAFTLFGIGILGFVLLRFFLVGSSVTGFPFLASIIAIFSGAQLFALGIIGEYLARMHFRLMERPTYVIRTGTDE